VTTTLLQGKYMYEYKESSGASVKRKYTFW